MDLHMADGQNSCSITKIATEILLQIIDYIPPASHFDFACTCKTIAVCSSDVLKRHFEAHLKYNIASDLSPTTVPLLLRSAFGYDDPIPAWHVRSFEIWHDRKSWDEWKPISFETPPSQDTQTPPISWDFFHGELEDYLDTTDFGKGASTALSEIEDGEDACLKAILLANCPRLRDVKFISDRRYLAGIRNYTTSGEWLQELISDSVRGKIAWGPGLESVRHVAVNVTTETWMDERDWDRSGSNGNQLLQLVRLPNIESIYFEDLVGPDYHHVDYAQKISPGSSSLKHLFLDNCGDHDDWEGDKEFLEALVAAPKALISASFRTCDARIYDLGDVVCGLCADQGTTLESLMFYEFGVNAGERSELSYLEDWEVFSPETLNGSQVLKNISMNIQDIERFALDIQDTKQERLSKSALLELVFAHNSFPKTIETLTLWDDPLSEYIDWGPSPDIGLEEALISLMNLKEEKYPQLKAIYLEDVERSCTEELWLGRAIDVGREKGVDVHTLTNRANMRYQFDFPEGLDKYDLATGPWGKRPENWVLDTFLGRRVPPGCGKCGNCEKCLEDAHMDYLSDDE